MHLFICKRDFFLRIISSFLRLLYANESVRVSVTLVRSSQLNLLSSLHTNAVDGQVEREAQTAPDPLGGHGLRGRGRDVAHRASLPEPSQGRVVKGGRARHVQKPGGATEPAARTHSQPGRGALKNLHTDMFFLNQSSRGQPLTLAAASWLPGLVEARHNTQSNFFLSLKTVSEKDNKMPIL